MARDDAHQASAPDPVEDPKASASGPRRSLDRRTLAIGACIALIGALVAGFVAVQVLGDDGGGETATLELLQMKDVELEEVDGGTTTLGASLGERPVLVNLWQPSCTPCIVEMPMLEQASQDNPRIAVLGITVQENLERAEALADQTGISYPWVWDRYGDFFAAAQATGLPTTLLFAANGSLLDVKAGVFADQAEVQAFIDDNVG